MTLEVKYKLYRSVHGKIASKYGKANTCENPNCSKKSKNYEWSNIDHKYSLDKKDWKMLCQICHVSFDRLYNNKYPNSESFRKKEQTKNMVPKNCLNCGERFMPHLFKQNQKYCCSTCRGYAWWVKNKERNNDN
jgi:hypothetical protein